MNLIYLSVLLIGLNVRTVLNMMPQMLEEEDEYDESIEIESSSISVFDDGDATESFADQNSTNLYESEEILTVTTTLKYDENESIAVQSKVSELSAVLKATIHRIRQSYKKMDIVFLIDSSSSVGKSNFQSELKFVVKFLSDFNVSYNYTRVSIVTFSSQGKIVRHVDHISEVSENNDKCQLLNFEIPKIRFFGGGTFTAGALKQARSILSKARRHSKKIVCLITDGFSNGQNPMPIAEKLKNDNVTIITFGIQSGNYAELHEISSDPGEEHSFLLDSFTQFESLARKALHSDYRIGNVVRIKNSTLCDTLCDKTNETESCCDTNAECTCSTISGHYSCLCNKGYYGDGLRDNCQLCPNGTYWHSWNLCKPCSDPNHITKAFPATNSSFCACKSGFLADDNNRCEILRCPLLQPPENGYFVKHPSGCGHVLNTACGARCKSGYQLIGSSIRLCQENGTWSGTEAKCVLKTCPKLPIPYYGMATCKNSDLNTFYDYTPRNATFMQYYDNEELRSTELMPIDTDCKFKCGPGFYMIGSAVRNCLPLSKWDGLQTTCKQILCSGLPEVNFGYYDPTDCTNQKVVHGSNCTLICEEGFEVKGPTVKTCTGKRSGVWSNRNKLPKCVDVVPPTLMCPENFSVPMNDDEDYAVVKIFPPPMNVTDNSSDNVTYWLKPSVKSDGVKLTLGNHTFTYVAIDAFRNKARCNFTITVLDITPPVIDNCIDPPEIFVPKIVNPSDNRSFVDWDDPIIYDNSNTSVVVTQTISPGYLDVGTHIVEYLAMDGSRNENTCVMNITVKALKCNVLPSPANGESLCARNESHTWCDVVCDFGYSMYQSDDELSDNLKLYCDNNNPQWKYDPLPDCTKVELPDSIEQVITITLDDDTNLCKNDSDSNDQENKDDLLTQIHKQLCENDEHCEVLSEIDGCDQVVENQTKNAVDDGTSQRNFYSIVKRDTSYVNFATPKTGTNLKIRVFTKYSKNVGYWNQTASRTDGHDPLQANDRVRTQLGKLQIDVKHLNVDEVSLCKNGSIFKRNVCVQCPKGTFHNRTVNSCQLCPFAQYNDRPAQSECQKCPMYHSTRKLGTKLKSECIEQCPPGTVARIRFRGNQKQQNSLMPFCRKCLPSQYQPQFDQTRCISCGYGMTSPRGSISINNCYPEQRSACTMNVAACGPHGVCVQENSNIYLYSCLCEEGFVGSHCEHQLDLCASAPCQNKGRCQQLNSTNYECNCPEKFTGELCEIEKNDCSINLCHNGGTCIESSGKALCECLPGFVGEYCEMKQNFCSTNPCESGQCINTINGFVCKCPPGVIGRRCHLRPCDYLPCHRNAQCIDLPVLDATRSSYVCQCPKGLRGFDCTQTKSACEPNPCTNNGHCQPNALRKFEDIGKVAPDEVDENIYEMYTCKCPPYFYGPSCEIFVTPDYVLEIEKSGTQNYVKLNGPASSLNEISLCVWIQTNDSFNYGTLFSYATDSHDNMFTLTDYNGIVLYVHGNNVITDITLNDGEWHFICVTWMSANGKYDIYIDGTLRDAGTNLSTNSFIEANGTIVIGQEQDSVGGSFSDSESFVGRFAYLDIWNRRISNDEMFEFYTTCEPYQGNLFTWTDFKSQIHGNIRILPSPFCRRCQQNLILPNGYIRYLSNRAFHYCYDGYRMQGSSIRNCLRTSKWSLPVPYCRSINCGYLPNLLDGHVSIEKTNFGELATYTCNENFYLVGHKTRLCQSNGTWSGSQPECISDIQCSSLTPPANGKLIYANERGRIKGDQERYPMGTFVEIQCENGAVLRGESFLTCIDSGNWDLQMPTCISPPSTTPLTGEPTTDIITVPFATVSSVSNSTAPVNSTPALASKMAVEVPSQEFLVEILLDKSFWTSLKQLYYYGCNNQKIVSTLCHQLVHPEFYTDLTSFELPETNEFRHMDVNLLSHLKAADEILFVYATDVQLDIENLLPFILYGSDMINASMAQMSETEKNAYRLVLCLYIDTILLDKNSTIEQIAPSDDENITKKLKYYLVRVSSKAYSDNLLKEIEGKESKKPTEPTIHLESHTVTPPNNSDVTNRNYRSAVVENTTPIMHKHKNDTILEPVVPDVTTETIVFQNNDSNSSIESGEDAIEIYETTTVTVIGKNVSTDIETHPAAVLPKDLEVEHESYEEVCQLEALPSFPPNSIVSEVKMDNEAIFKNPDRLYLIGPVAISTRVHFACKEGFKSLVNQSFYFECSDKLEWIGDSIKCEAITCEQPQTMKDLIYNAKSSKNLYFFGQKLQLRCNKGYTLNGEPYVQCLETGKWSRNLSRCSRISCKEPHLPTGAKILRGSSFLYMDKVMIQCDKAQQTVEIVCQADGNWSRSSNEMCQL